MSALDRVCPDPLPRIHPQPEYLATGLRKQQYEEVKHALQVPWMGVVTMAYAHYPTFFERMWHGLKPLVASRPFAQQVVALCRFSEAQAEALHAPPLEARLRELGYADRELDQIRGVLEVFSHGNFPYLVMATIVRLLLEGGEISGAGEAPPFQGVHFPQPVPLALMEAHHADAPTRLLYDDIKATLRLPFVNTDYRALARWPSYFALAWADLKEALTGPAYQGICLAIHERAVEIAAALPNPRRLTSRELKSAAERDAGVAEVLQVSRLFQWLLPGLVTNVAFFRAQLQQPRASQSQ